MSSSHVNVFEGNLYTEYLSLGLFFLVLYELIATCDVAPEGISDQLIFSQQFFTSRLSPLSPPQLPQCLSFTIRSLGIALRPPTKRCRRGGESRIVSDDHASLIRRCFTVRPDNPWDSEEIHSSRRCVPRSERRWKRNKLTIDKEIMLRGLQELHNMINNAKTTFLESQIRDSSRKKVSLFRLIDSLLLPKPVLRLPVHSSLTELVERFGNFFVSKIVKIREDLDAAVGLCLGVA